MKQTSVGKIAIATAAFACATLLSFGWSGERGVSLSIESAQARVSHQVNPASPAGVSRRHYRRAAYGPGGVVGAGVAAGAVGTAAAIATAPFGGPYAYAGPGGPGWAGGYYASSPWGDYACSPSAAGCRPYASKDWSR